MADLPKEPITRQEEYLSRLAGENTTLPREPITREEMYLEGAIARVEAVEEEVEEIKNNPDVVDIVATYADLQAYDKSKLTDKDVIRVLADETHSGNSTYYRYNKSSNDFTFIAEITGGGDGVYSTKTTSNASDGGAIYIGTLGTDQKPNLDPTTNDAHKRYIWMLPFNASSSATSNGVIPGNESINLGGQQGTSAGQGGDYNVSIGYRSVIANSVNQSVVLGFQAKSYAAGGLALGSGAFAIDTGSVALGRDAQTTRVGEVNVGTGNFSGGFQSTKYRVIGGVHDPVQDHDAATKGYVDAHSGQPTKFYLNSDTLSANMQLYKDASYTTPATSQNVVDSFLNNNAIIIAVGGTVYPTGYYHAMIYKIAYINDWKEDNVITPYFYDEGGNMWYVDTDGKIGEPNN